MSVQSTLTGLGDEIRELSGESSKMTLDQMTETVSEANEEVSSQGATIEEIQAALEGRALVLGARSTGGGSTGPRYGKAVCFGSVMCAPSDGSKGLMDYVAESGAYESITTYADSSYSVTELPDLVEEHVADIQNADIVFLEFGMNEMVLIMQSAAEGQWIVGSPSFAAAFSGAGGETMCAALYYSLFTIKEANPTAKIVWLQPWRWTGYSETAISAMLAGSSMEDSDVGTITEINLLGDIFLLMEATLLRVVRNCGGSIIDLGMSFIDQMLGNVDIDQTEMLAQAVISNPFRDAPAPALQRTISTISLEETAGAAIVAFPMLLYYMAMLDVELHMDITLSSIPFPFRLQYVGINFLDGNPALAFSATYGTEAMFAKLPITGTDGEMVPVAIEVHKLATEDTTTTTETTETTES